VWLFDVFSKGVTVLNVGAMTHEGVLCLVAALSILAHLLLSCDMGKKHCCV